MELPGGVISVGRLMLEGKSLRQDMLALPHLKRVDNRRRNGDRGILFHLHQFMDARSS